MILEGNRTCMTQQLVQDPGDIATGSRFTAQTWGPEALWEFGEGSEQETRRAACREE